MRIPFLVSLVAIFCIMGCGSDDDLIVCTPPGATDLRLNFKANFGDGELDFNTTEYDYQGMVMTVSKFDFYISNISLFNNIDGVIEKTELFEIEFIDFTQNNNSVTIQAGSVPLGTYDGIVFSIGVPSDLNSQIPGDFSTTHPLGFTNLSHHWEDWNSYIFAKIEGRLDTSGNQDYQNFSYHTGGDEQFRADIEKDIALDLELGVIKTINFEVDLENIFLNGGALDIQAYPDSHNLGELTAATHVMDNFQSSISVQ